MYTIYDSEAYDFEGVKKDICEFNDIAENEISDQSVWNLISEYLMDDWTEAKSILKSVNGKWSNATWIVAGDIAGWRGTHYGYKLTDDICKTISELGDMIKVTTENGHLKIEAHHHDGGCYVEAKILTDKGKELYDRWNYYLCGNDKSEADILDTIFMYNLFSKLPHLEKAIE